MNASEIRKVFESYGVPLSSNDAWQVQGTWVIKHSALERLAAKANVSFDDPQIIINTEDKIVLFVRGHRRHFSDTYSEWTYGEVSMNVSGSNYKVSGKQAAYPWAMVEKRAKDRLIIKLAGLHGLYSEDEADDFKSSAPKAERDQTARVSPPEEEPKSEQPPDPKPQSVPVTDDGNEDDPFKRLNPQQKEIVDAVAAMTDTVQVTDYMMSDAVKEIMASSEKVDSLLIRAFATKRLKDLGYPLKRKS